MGSSATRRVALAGLGLLGMIVGAQSASADIKIEERTSGLDSTVTRWTFIKGDKRSIVTRAETSGTLYNAGARYGAHVEIARPDKELIWEINPQERSYREVTFQQLGKLVQKGVQAPRDPNEQPLRSLYSSQTTAIEVVPTGESKKIAGFPAEQVMARVVVGVQNLISGNKFSFTFDQEIWLTKDPRVMSEIEPFETAYVETFGTALSLSQAQVTAGEWNDAFITHLRAVNDRVRALKGFPLATTTTVTEESIAQNKGEKGTKRKLTVASTEVRKIHLETLPETEFELPAGYINADTKVAVAPRTGPGTVAAVTPQPMMNVVKNDVMAPTPPVTMVEKPTAPLVAKNDVPTPSKTDATAARMDVNPTPSVTPASPDKRNAVAAATTNPGAGSADSVPHRPVVTSPPTNVVVPGSNNVVAAAPTRNVRRPKGEPIQPALVTGYTAPAVANNYPVISLGLSRTQAAPPPVVIDEPYALRKKKRR